VTLLEGLPEETSQPSGTVQRRVPKEQSAWRQPARLPVLAWQASVAACRCGALSDSSPIPAVFNHAICPGVRGNDPFADPFEPGEIVQTSSSLLGEEKLLISEVVNET